LVVGIKLVYEAVKCIFLLFDGQEVVEVRLANESDLVQVQDWNDHNFVVALKVGDPLNIDAKLYGGLDSYLSKLQISSLIFIFLAEHGILVKEPVQVLVA